MVGPKNGGSLDRVHIEAGIPVFSRFFHNIVPYLDCCLLSDNCAKYYKKRPSDDGSNYEPPRPGKPHITYIGISPSSGKKVEKNQKEKHVKWGVVKKLSFFSDTS